jgi:hypothetical protein
VIYTGRLRQTARSCKALRVELLSERNNDGRGSSSTTVVNQAPRPARVLTLAGIHPHACELRLQC